MKQTSEFSLFLLLACFILVAIVGFFPKDGTQSSGAGGEEIVSIEAAAATIVEMVESWEQPPQAQPQLDIELETAPTTEITAPSLPQIDLAQAPQAKIQIAAIAPALEHQPEFLDLATHTPPTPQPVSVADLETPQQPQIPNLPQVQPTQEAPNRPRIMPQVVNQSSEQNPEVETTTAPLPPEQEPTPRPKPRPKVQPETGQTAEVTSEGRIEQRAAGAGAGSQAGASGATQASTQSAGQKAKLKKIWGAKIRSRIERRKRYPSRQQGSGRVVIRITIARDGTLLNYRITKSSGNPAFDSAAVNAVTRVGRFPSAPKKLGASKIKLSLPIDFFK